MRINDLLLESTHPLFESVLPSYHPTVRLGEDLARTITEAALTADQISQLFQTVQKLMLVVVTVLQLVRVWTLVKQ